jgi:septal ring factor EnvC (AmiA/AmiB activator)
MEDRIAGLADPAQAEAIGENLAQIGNSVINILKEFAKALTPIGDVNAKLDRILEEVIAIRNDVESLKGDIAEMGDDIRISRQE